MTIATPLLLLLILAVVQLGLWWHAAHITATTATHALAATRTTDGTQAAGHAEARSMLTELGGGLIQHPQIHIRRNATTARVQITAQCQPIIPLFQLPLRAETAGRIERWTTP